LNKPEPRSFQNACHFPGEYDNHQDTTCSGISPSKSPMVLLRKKCGTPGNTEREQVGKKPDVYVNEKSINRESWSLFLICSFIQPYGSLCKMHK